MIEFLINTGVSGLVFPCCLGSPSSCHPIMEILIICGSIYYGSFVLPFASKAPVLIPVRTRAVLQQLRASLDRMFRAHRSSLFNLRMSPGHRRQGQTVSRGLH